MGVLLSYLSAFICDIVSASAEIIIEMSVLKLDCHFLPSCILENKRCLIQFIADKAWLRSMNFRLNDESCEKNYLIY